MNKKGILLIGIVVFLIALLIILYIFNINKKEINIKYASKLNVVLTINKKGTIKKIKPLNDDAKKINEKKLINKNIRKAGEIIINEAIDKKILNKGAYSYNLFVTIMSSDKKEVERFKQIIKEDTQRKKLKNNSFIELFFNEMNDVEKKKYEK